MTCLGGLCSYMDIHSLRRISRPQAPGGQLSITSRLSLLMLVVYATPGAIVPLFSLRLEQLGFSPADIGWCCATQALGSLIAPLIAGHIADRWFPPERCLCVTAFTACIATMALGGIEPAHRGLYRRFVFLAGHGAVVDVDDLDLLCPFKGPGAPIRPGAHVGHRRLGRAGLAGWSMAGRRRLVVAGDALAAPEQPHPELADAFRVAAVLAALFGFYALSLPRHVAEKIARRGGAAGRDSGPEKPGVLYLCDLHVWSLRGAAVSHAGDAAPVQELECVRRLDRATVDRGPGFRGAVAVRAPGRLRPAGDAVHDAARLARHDRDAVGVDDRAAAWRGRGRSRPVWILHQFLSRRRANVSSSALAQRCSIKRAGVAFGALRHGAFGRKCVDRASASGFGGAFPPTYAIAAVLAIMLFGVFVVGFPRAEKGAARRTA